MIKPGTFVEYHVKTYYVIVSIFMVLTWTRASSEVATYARGLAVLN